MKNMARSFSALYDPTRLAVVEKLMGQGHCLWVERWGGAKGCFEPTGDQKNPRCVRSQHEICCNGSSFVDAMQRTLRSFVQLLH